MPLYEYLCPSCEATFEVLASLSEATKKKPCPECGRRAPRVVSAFAIASGGGGHHEAEAAQAPPPPRDPRPLCMRYSGIPLSCHMDEPSLKRFVAHAQGRGAEYDDKRAAATELRKQRGIPEPVAASPSHGHDHHHFRRHGASQAATRKDTHDHEHGQAHGHNHSHDHGHGRGKGKIHSHAPGAHAH